MKDLISAFARAPSSPLLSLTGIFFFLFHPPPPPVFSINDDSTGIAKCKQKKSDRVCRLDEYEKRNRFIHPSQFETVWVCVYLLSIYTVMVLLLLLLLYMFIEIHFALFLSPSLYYPCCVLHGSRLPF